MSSNVRIYVVVRISRKVQTDRSRPSYRPLSRNLDHSINRSFYVTLSTGVAGVDRKNKNMKNYERATRETVPGGHSVGIIVRCQKPSAVRRRAFPPEIKFKKNGFFF